MEQAPAVEHTETENPAARRSPRLAVPVVTLVAIVLVGISSTRWQPSSEPLAGRPDRVLVFGIDHTSLDDLGRGATPNLDRLIRRGALGATSVRTLAHRSSTSAGYATFGASARVSTKAELADARDTTGSRVTVPGAAAIRQLVHGLHLSSGAGALGDALHAAHLRTAAVGNADAVGSSDVLIPAVSRPAPLAVMDRAGRVDGGTVDRADVLEADPTAPFGVRADPVKVERDTIVALNQATVVVVDAGDLDRAAAATTGPYDRTAMAQHRLALERTDALLGRLEGDLPSRTMLVVTSVSTAPSSYLGPTVVTGPGVPSGYLESPSTKRLGVVTITDLAPTVLAALHVPPPGGMIGHALRYHPGAVSMGYLRGLDQDTRSRETTYIPITLAFIVAQAVVYLVAAITGTRRRRPGWRAGGLRTAALAIAAFPLATFVVRLLPALTRGGLTGMWLSVVAIDVACAVVAEYASRANAVNGLGWILAATVALLIVDTATGSRLELSSWLGYSLYSAGRFYGLPNTSYAVLATAALVWACIHVDGSEDRSRAVAIAGGLFVLVIVVLATPTLGANVGAILTLVPVFGLTALVLRGRRLAWRSLVLAGGATAVVLAAGAGIDMLRPASARSHFGGFVSSVHGGGIGVLITTVSRKEIANLRILQSSLWTWVLPLALATTWFLLRSRVRRAALLPPGSAIRVCAVSSAFLAGVGVVTSDSGPVFVALVFAFVGPLLLLRDIETDPALQHFSATPARSG